MQDQLDFKMNVIITCLVLGEQRSAGPNFFYSVDLLFTRHCPDFANGKGKFIISHAPVFHVSLQIPQMGFELMCAIMPTGGL